MGVTEKAGCSIFMLYLVFLYADRIGGVNVTVKQRQAPKGRQTDHQEKLNELSASLDSLRETCLNSMAHSFSTDEEQIFYQAFVCAFWENYHKRKLNKNHFWSLKTLLISALGVSGAGGLILGGIFALLNTLVSLREKGDFDAELLQLIMVIKSHWLFCFLAVAACMAVWFCLVCFKRELARRNYRETWVRNSVAYHRLFLAMIQFQSNRIGKEEFMDRVFEVLESNLDKFEYNITGTGAAEKCSAACEKPSSG